MARCTRYNINVIKFVSDLRHVGDTPVSSINKTDGHDITKILLKVALNTINQSVSVSLHSNRQIYVKYGVF
jgi:hypothetical protein